MTSLTRHHTNPFFPVAFAVSQRASHLVHAGKPKKWDKNQQEHGKIGTDVKTRETEKQKKGGDNRKTNRVYEMIQWFSREYSNRGLFATKTMAHSRCTTERQFEFPSCSLGSRAFFTETRPVAQLAPKPLIKVRRRPIFPRFSAPFSQPLYISLSSLLGSSLFLFRWSSLYFVLVHALTPSIFASEHGAYARTFWHGDVSALVPPRLRITDTTWLRLIYKPVMSLWSIAS